jgi:hypothetical protein
MNDNRLPSEVELVFELMPCNAQRTTYGPSDPKHPGASLHPCGYFQKWGTYHSYDYESAGPPLKRGTVALPLYQYVGRARLVPEMLSGCRKAPIMAVGINPNLPGWWPASRNSVNPLFDDYQQYAHYFRYRQISKLDIPQQAYKKFGGGPADTPFAAVELKVPRDTRGFRTIPVEPQMMAMYQNYQSLLDDLARAMQWNAHRLSIGEDVSYGNMVACPSAKWITKPDPTDPSMPSMTAAEQTGIVNECFHQRKYFLRQLFQSLPTVLMVFSQSTTDAFLGEMAGHFSKGKPKPGDKIEDLLNQEIRLKFGADKNGEPLEARVIFSPHITGDPAHFGPARAKVLSQLVEEAKAGRVSFNPLTGHLSRPPGGCVFCPMLEIGTCDYADELTPLSDAPGLSADSPTSHLMMEKQVTRSLLEEFLAINGPTARAVKGQVVPTMAAPARKGWQLSGHPERETTPPAQPTAASKIAATEDRNHA